MARRAVHNKGIERAARKLANFFVLLGSWFRDSFLKVGMPDAEGGRLKVRAGRPALYMPRLFPLISGPHDRRR
jgi:hypothetical protein